MDNQPNQLQGGAPKSDVSENHGGAK